MRTLVITIAAAVALSLTGCSGGSQPTAVRSSLVPSAQLRAEGTGQVGAAIQKETPGRPYVFALRALCTTGRPIRITSVRAYGASHMRVVAWGVRLRTPQSTFSLSGDKDGVVGVPADNPGYAHRPVTVICGAKLSKGIDDFAVGVEFTGKRGTMHGVRIGYDTGRAVRSQFAIALCSTLICARAT